MSATVHRFVLIRGLAREAGHWHEFDRGLTEHFADAVIERHDLPGNGARWRDASPLDVGAMAAELRASVWAEHRSPTVLVAISLGAMVCLEWLRRWPADPLVGLVAINTSVGGLCWPWERMRVPASLYTLRTLLERDPVACELAVLDLTTSEHRRDRALAEQHAAIHRERPIRRSNVLRQMIATASFRVDRFTPAIPVLLLNSARDRMVDPRCSQKLAHTLDDPRWCWPVNHRYRVWHPGDHPRFR
jgi:pimeloyl-ACP methyl ester carboxylesterase